MPRIGSIRLIRDGQRDKAYAGLSRRFVNGLRGVRGYLAGYVDGPSTESLIHFVV